MDGGRGRGDDVAAAVEQLDGHAAEPGLAGILDAVAVDVVPDAVADRAGAAVAEVEVRTFSRPPSRWAGRRVVVKTPASGPGRELEAATRTL